MHLRNFRDDLVHQDKDIARIVIATVSEHAGNLRGRIPAPIVKVLKAKAGDLLAFEELSDGSILLRKSIAAERKAVASTKAPQRSKTNQASQMIALARIAFEDGIERGRIPLPVVKMLKVKSGEMVAFECRIDGSIIIRRSRAGERKTLTLSRYRKDS
jgi:antitoxin component of MazEF toxin-antitoxin module